MNETTAKAPIPRPLKGATRRPVQTSNGDPVTVGFLPEARSTPVLITPAGPGVDLPGGLRATRDLVDAQLWRHGAVLLRGFPGGSVDWRQQAALAVCDTLYP